MVVIDTVQCIGIIHTRHGHIMYLITDTFNTLTIVIVDTICRCSSRGFAGAMNVIITDLTTFIVICSDTVVIEVRYFITYNIDAVIRSGRAVTGERDTIVCTTGSSTTCNNLIVSDVYICNRSRGSRRSI
ncbi:hypothetical protein D3C72_747000 [compost metagenome]